MNTTIPFVIYITSYIVSGTILTIMITYVWVNRKLLFPNLSVFLLASAWIWLVCELCEYLFPEAGTKVLFDKLQYVGITMLPPSWIGFVYYYINRNIKRTLFFVCASGFVCAGFLALVLTNDLHNLLWNNVRISVNMINVEKDLTTFYYAYRGINVSLFLAGLCYLFIRLLGKTGYRRKQGTTILVGVFVPFLALVLGAFLPPEYSYMDFTPICFSVSSLVIVYFIRLRYYRTIPLAQHIVTESMKDLLVILNPDNLIIYLNPAAYGLFDGTNERIIGRHLEEMLPVLDEAIKNVSSKSVHNQLISMNGVYYDLSVSPIKSGGTKPIGTVLVLRDITRLKTVEENLTHMKEDLEARVEERMCELASINVTLQAEIEERKKTEEKLHVSLTEKDILLGEIHHRVKNNLQVIMSLLKLQKNQITDPKALQNFNTAISRIQSIAMIHERLYKSKDLANTQFSDYINQLTREIVYLHSDYGSAIYLAVNAENIYLDIDRSILCGLVLNELILNAIKYAFPVKPATPSAEMNRLSVDFFEEGETYVLKTADNGVGLPDGFDPNGTDTLGMKIINTLVKQLSGTISIATRNGTEVTVRFPKKKRT